MDLGTMDMNNKRGLEKVGPFTHGSIWEYLYVFIAYIQIQLNNACFFYIPTFL